MAHLGMLTKTVLELKCATYPLLEETALETNILSRDVPSNGVGAKESVSEARLREQNP
jgi:hypothetical protein